MPNKTRTITEVLSAHKAIDDGDMLLWRALPQRDRLSIGPYVFVDHYKHQSKRGIGDKPHPHAGIEVISYLFEGGVAHRDSKGLKGELNALDAQYINAGRGMIHAEQPTSGRHGLQLWTSLPADKKLMEPSYQEYHSDKIPEFNKDQAIVRVIAGHLEGHNGPIQTQTTNLLAHVRLPANQSVTLDVDEKSAEELGIYVVIGQLALADGRKLGSESIAVLSTGNSVTLTASDADVELVLLGGDTIKDNLIFDGPFVMDTEERIVQAYEDYHSGKMGQLV